VYIYAADYNNYNNSNYYFGINSRGSVTGVVMLFFAVGIIGVVLFFLYFIQLFSQVQYKRFKWTLLGVVLFDFIFYNAQMIYQPCMQVLMIFLLLFANIQYDKNGNFMDNQRSFFYEK